MAASVALEPETLVREASGVNDAETVKLEAACAQGDQSLQRTAQLTLLITIERPTDTAQSITGVLGKQ